MKKFLSALTCGVLLIVMLLSVCACSEEKHPQNNDDAENTDVYSLTVQDHNDYLIEPLQKSYKAGENVTVKTEVLLDVDMIAYLDDVSLGSQRPVRENDEYHWEFYFVMPAHDAVLRFELSGGM